MKKKKIIILKCSLIIFLSIVITNNAYAAEQFKRFSIGINNLPWKATGVSFRWWHNKHKGNEFFFKQLYAFIGNEETTFGSGDTPKIERIAGFRMREVRFLFLRRRKSPFSQNLFITYGAGMSAATDYDEKEYTSGTFSRIRLSLLAPLGFEHFFLKKYPFVSYSIEALLCVYGDYNEVRVENSSGYKNIRRVTTFNMSLSPQFFLRFYIK